MAKKRSLSFWVKYVHGWACRKGWWSPEPAVTAVLLNIHSEVSEASEELRKGVNKNVYSYPILSTLSESGEIEYLEEHPEQKPEGFAIELVDVVIRIMDYFGARGWDFERLLALKMRHNETRPHRHGGKTY